MPSCFISTIKIEDLQYTLDIHCILYVTQQTHDLIIDLPFTPYLKLPVCTLLTYAFMISAILCTKVFRGYKQGFIPTCVSTTHIVHVLTNRFGVLFECGDVRDSLFHVSDKDSHTVGHVPPQTISAVVWVPHTGSLGLVGAVILLVVWSRKKTPIMLYNYLRVIQCNTLIKSQMHQEKKKIVSK